MYRKGYFVLLLFLFLFCSFSYGETVSQCDALYNHFVEDGFFPEKLSLNNTTNYTFPYNIILESQSKSAAKVFITIENALYIVSELEKVSEYATVICTANDFSIMNPETPAGTIAAINSFAFEEFKAPILILSIRDKSENYWSITPGSNGYITPSYCFRKIKNALEKENITSYIDEGSLALYKLKLVKENPILATVLENEYPAVQLNFPLGEYTYLENVVRNFSEDYDVINQKNKEVNYDSITIFSKNYTISESTLTLIFIFIIIFSLFSICLLSFMFGRRKLVHKKTMVKYWFIAPLFFLIVFLCLTLGQIITKWIFPTWKTFPQFAIIVKFIISVFLFSLIYILRKKLKIPSRIFIYSYLLNIVSVVNLFVFAALDLPLIILFGVEIILIYISQGFKKPVLLILTTLFLILPFIPALFGIFSNSDFQALHLLVNGNFFVNLILSLLILPFTFMIMRIILSIKIKHHSNKKMIIKLCINISLLIGFSLATLFFNNYLEKKYGTDTIETKYIETSNNLISYELTAKENIGFYDNILTINSLENVIYYDIKIFSDYPFPIYSANYPFDFFQTNNAAQFNLPENPPEKMDLEFLSDTNANYTIEIVVYALAPKSNISEDIEIYVKSYSIEKSGAKLL